MEEFSKYITMAGTKRPLGFVQTKQGGWENCWGLYLIRFLHHLHHLLPSTSNSPPLWQWVYRKLASTKTWWAYKSPAADRGRCLASRVGGDRDLITLCHRALGWKTQTSARAKMASGLGEQASHCDLECDPKRSDGETKEHGPFKDAAKWNENSKTQKYYTSLVVSYSLEVVVFSRSISVIYVFT